MMWQTDQNSLIQTATQINNLFHQSTLINKQKGHISFPNSNQQFCPSIYLNKQTKRTYFFPPMCCCTNQLSIKAIIQHVCLNKTWMVHYNLQ